MFRCIFNGRPFCLLCREHPCVFFMWIMTVNDIDPGNITTRKQCFDLISHLVSRGTPESLEYHYALFKDPSVEEPLYSMLRTFFFRHGQSGEDFVTNCILVSIQEITGKTLGLSSSSHRQPSKNKIIRAKKTALEYLKSV